MGKARSPGRPSKLTAATKQKLTRAIALGATYELACQSAGIAYQTFRQWMLKGEAAQTGEYRDFVEAVRASEGRGAVLKLGKIDRAALDDWRAAAWILERRYPKQFGKAAVESEAQREFERTVMDTIGELEPDAARKIVERLGLRRSLQQPSSEA